MSCGALSFIAPAERENDAVEMKANSAIRNEILSF